MVLSRSVGAAPRAGMEYLVVLERSRLRAKFGLGLFSIYIYASVGCQRFREVFQVDAEVS